MPNNTPRTNARTTGESLFQPAPGSSDSHTKTILPNTPVTVFFRPSGEFDLLATVKNPTGDISQYVRRDVPRSAFELIDSAVNEDA